MAFLAFSFFMVWIFVNIYECNSFSGISPPYGAYINNDSVLMNVARSENGGRCFQYIEETECNKLIDGIFYSSQSGHAYSFGSSSTIQFNISFDAEYEIIQLVIHKDTSRLFIKDMQLEIGDSIIDITLSSDGSTRFEYFNLDNPILTSSILFSVISKYIEGSSATLFEVQVLTKLTEPSETSINVASTYYGGSCTGISSSGDSCSILIDDVIIFERPFYWFSNVLHSLRFDFAKMVHIQQVVVEGWASSSRTDQGIISFDSQSFTYLYFSGSSPQRFVYNLTAETTYMIFTLTRYTQITEIYVYGNFLQEIPTTEALIPLPGAPMTESVVQDGQLTTLNDFSHLETNTGTTATRNDDTSSILMSTTTLKGVTNSQSEELGPEVMYGIIGSLGALVLISLIIVVILVVRLWKTKFESNNTNDIKIAKNDVPPAQLNRNPTYDRPTNSKYETMVSADYTDPYTALKETNQEVGGEPDGNVPKYETMGAGDYTDPYTILSK